MCDLYLVQTFAIISASDERFISTLGWLLTLILTGIMLLVSMRIGSRHKVSVEGSGKHKVCQCS